MALIVKVFINDRCIIDTHAVRIMGKPHDMCLYKTDTNHILHHHYDAGGAALAIELLKIYDRESKGGTSEQDQTQQGSDAKEISSNTPAS